MVSLLRDLSEWAALLVTDLRAFLWAVFWQLKILMGGVIMFVLKIFELTSGRKISPQVYLSLIVGFIAIAVFYAWREERGKWEQLGGNAPLALTLRELVQAYRAH